MFLNIFIYRLKCTVRDKALVFWTLFFPLILATFFNMAFSNITKHEEFTSPEIAVVDNEQYQKDQYFKNFLIEHSAGAEASDGSVKLFNVHAASLEKAREMLENGQVIGYITVGAPIGFTVKNSGFYQTIVKSILDDYSQTAKIAGNIIKNDPAVQKGLLEDLQNRKEYTREARLGTKDKPDSTVNYFYSLIAMACMYGSFFGLKEITDTQANLSKQAARLNIAPVHKLKALLAGLSAIYIVSLVEIMVLIGYMVFGLKVDFGDQIGLISLTCIAGCATGITSGAFISAVVKKNEGVKTAILIASNMTCAFLSGMMLGNMKYIVQQKLPILSYINPVALITDAFYALYYYDTHTRFFTNIGLLGGFTVLFSLMTYMIIRRQRYESI